jgi:SAM-dependent methyltransferase
MKKYEYLEFNKNIIEGKTVLDLACHTGESTSIIQQLGAKYIYGVDARQQLIDQAKTSVQNNVEFFVGDIQTENLIVPLAKKSDTVIVLGALYHLYNHFGFLSHILRPNIEHLLIETVAGPETLNPEMFWGFEMIDNIYNGWHDLATVVPNGTPNLSWIIQSAKLFGFECDWVRYYGKLQPKQRCHVTLEEYMSIKDESWPDYETIISNTPLPQHVESDISAMLGQDDKDSGGNKRMLIRLYNKQLINSVPVDVKECYIWNPE